MNARSRSAIGLLVAFLVGGALSVMPAAAADVEFQRGKAGKLSLVVRERPVAEVFEMLAKQARVNVLLSADIEGEVSVNLFDVSLDTAIRAIAEAAGFVAERRRGTYVIVERDEAGRDFAHGNTKIRTFSLEYSEPDLVSAIVEKQLSRYGTVAFLEKRRLLIVEDLPDFVDRIERLVNELDREPHQILIEAKILDVKLDDDESLGVDWRGTFDASDGGGTLAQTGLAFAGTPGLLFDLLTSDVEATLTALDDEGRIRTLSTPTLRALEHEEAEVVIGDRQGFRVTTTINAVTTESVEFLESGVILKFEGAVDRLGRIVLDIHPEVSTGTIDGGLPSQMTTEVTTRLVLEDGQRIFIAGLIRDTETKTQLGIPILMKIPYLGSLFSVTTTSNAVSEVVVVLAAHVIKGATHELGRSRAQRLRDAEQELEQGRRALEDNFDEAPAALFP